MKSLIRFIVAATAVLLLAVQVAPAQKKASAQRLFGTNVQLVLTNDNIIYDGLLASVVKKEWKATPYQLIDASGFATLRTDSAKFFVLMHPVKEGKGNTERIYYYLSLLVGNPAAANDINKMEVLSTLPVGCADEDEVTEGMLRLAVLFLQRDAKLASEGFYDKNLTTTFQGGLSSNNYNMDELKGKRIVMFTYDLASTITPGKVNEMLKNNVSFVKEEELETLMSTGTATDTVVAIVVTPTNPIKGVFSYKMIMGLGGELYYFYHETNPKNFRFTNKDFDMLRRVY